jgi:hypothetical protein
MTLDQIASFASLVAVVATAIGGYAVHHYRTGQQDANIRDIKAAHDSEVRELRARMDRMESERNSQYNAIMKALNDLNDHLGNRLTAIETTLKVQKEKE